MLIDERYCLIAESHPSGFSFPYVTVSAQNRSFQKQWLNEFTWLAYTNLYNGAFCKCCVVFAPQTVSRSAKPPGSLVSGPHCNYKKAKEHYHNHQNCHYHKLCAAMFDNFVQTDADKSRDVLFTHQIKSYFYSPNRIHFFKLFSQR